MGALKHIYFFKIYIKLFQFFKCAFQSKKTLIHVQHFESKKIFLTLGQNCIKKSELNVSCEVRSPDILLPVKDVFLGYECEEFLKSLNEENVNKIKYDCLQFYITALKEMPKRLPLQDNKNMFLVKENRNLHLNY